MPRSVKGRGTSSHDQTPAGRVQKSPGTNYRPTRARAVLNTVLAAVAGLILGFFQLLVISQLVPSDESNNVSGWAAAVLILAFLLLIASPFIGGALYFVYGWKRKSTYTKEPKSKRVAATTVKKNDILSGMVDMAIIRQVVDVVMERLLAYGAVQRLEAARRKARKK